MSRVRVAKHCLKLWRRWRIMRGRKDYTGGGGDDGGGTGGGENVRTLERDLKCVCGMEFELGSALREHMSAKGHVTDVVESFIAIAGNRNGSQELRSRVFNCEGIKGCNAKLQSEGARNEHARATGHGVETVRSASVASSNPKDGQYRCHTCDRRFGSEAAMKEHMLANGHGDRNGSESFSHSPPVGSQSHSQQQRTCDDDGTQFISESTIDEHIRTKAPVHPNFLIQSGKHPPPSHHTIQTCLHHSPTGRYLPHRTKQMGLRSHTAHSYSHHLVFRTAVTHATPRSTLPSSSYTTTKASTTSNAPTAPHISLPAPTSSPTLKPPTLSPVPARNSFPQQSPSHATDTPNITSNVPNVRSNSRASHISCFICRNDMSSNVANVLLCLGPLRV